jgi:CARDB
MLRRALALGGGLIALILLVLAVKGCLDARANRALENYAEDVGQIVAETEQTSKDFFGKLSDPGGLTVTDFVAEVNADRSAMDSYASRIDGLDAPGDMSNAQTALELTYELRSSAMNEIADKMPTALGEAGSAKAVAGIARQMRKLFAADALYETVVRPEIDAVLADNGIEGQEVPESEFLPEGTKWLEEDAIAAALGTVSGSSAADASGLHGTELTGVSINGTELGEEAVSIPAGETPEVEVEVENQGESAEENIGVTVSAGGAEIEGSVETVETGETAVVSIPLTPAPKGEVTLEVKVDTVPGEEVAENNEATFTVVFE